MRIKNKVVILTVILALFVILSANIKNVDLNKRAVVIGVGVDKSDDGYELTIQTFAVRQMTDSSPDSSKAVTVGVSAATIGEAAGRLGDKIGKKLSFALCSAVLFGDEFAKEGVRPALNFFLRQHDAATDAAVVYCEGSAKEAMRIESPVNSGGMLLLRDLLKDKTAKDYVVKTLKDFSAETNGKGHTSRTPQLSKVKGGEDTEKNNSEGDDSADDKQNEYYELKRTAVFVNGAYSLSLSNEESAYLDLVDGGGNGGGGRFGYQLENGKKASFEVIKRSRKKKCDLNDASYNAELRAKLRLTDLVTQSNGNDLFAVKLNAHETAEVENKLSRGIEDTLDKCYGQGADVLGLEEMFYRKFGRRWRDKDGMDISREIKVSVVFDGV